MDAPILIARCVLVVLSAPWSNMVLLHAVSRTPAPSQLTGCRSKDRRRRCGSRQGRTRLCRGCIPPGQNHQLERDANRPKARRRFRLVRRLVGLDLPVPTSTAHSTPSPLSTSEIPVVQELDQAWGLVLDTLIRRFKDVRLAWIDFALNSGNDPIARTD